MRKKSVAAALLALTLVSAGSAVAQSRGRTGLHDNGGQSVHDDNRGQQHYNRAHGDRRQDHRLDHNHRDTGRRFSPHGGERHKSNYRNPHHVDDHRRGH